ncbi:hypothetical protein D3C72_1310990 [compost metagenome]
MLGVVAVVNLDQVAFLQVTQQSLAGLLQGIGRYGIALLARPQEEVGDISGQPILFLAIRAPQTETAVVALHTQQVLDAHLDLALAHIGRFAGNAKTFERRSIGIQRWVKTTGGLLQATIGVGFQRADLLGEVQRRTAGQRQHGLQTLWFECSQIRIRQAPRLIRERHAVVLEHGRVRRADAQGPLAAERRGLLAWQLQPQHLHFDLALTQSAYGLHRQLQSDPLALRQVEGLFASAHQVQLAFSAQLHRQFLRLPRQVRHIQRQGSGVASSKEARGRQLGNQRRGDHGLGFSHTVALVGPGLRH